MLQAIHIIYFTTRMRYSIYRQVEDEQFHGCQANCVANCAVNGMIGISWDSEVMPQMMGKWWFSRSKPLSWFRGFHSHGATPLWMVYNGKSF